MTFGRGTGRRKKTFARRPKSDARSPRTLANWGARPTPGTGILYSYPDGPLAAKWLVTRGMPIVPLGSTGRGNLSRPNGLPVERLVALTVRQTVRNFVSFQW